MSRTRRYFISKEFMCPAKYRRKLLKAVRSVGLTNREIGELILCEHTTVSKKLGGIRPFYWDEAAIITEALKTRKLMQIFGKGYRAHEEKVH